ncbi:hypothetical protein HYH03_002725 [Edaphochlamys debaryana]|uniref:Uncharacterized protein n=1 Tax=Edaphochlamys debaryana TaxID=47281 RepID=A0A835YA56_9CHLO|nr:hypothetical protein HYH03_002725 [Edaphochlamys debaryana]|eukprot:KAG2499142.1 hypothetical protein HYH03_002725 [Edaphochlamys debaryana]
MSRRVDPKARAHLNEAAATGRRRAQVQEQSSRQRDVTLRSRRLMAELASGGGALSEGALASLGPDVLAERVKAVAATLAQWQQLPAAEWQTALQQLATLLSSGSYQAVSAAVAAGAAASLAGLLQLPPQQLAADAARRAAWALELMAANNPAAAGEVLAAAGPALVARLTAVASAAAAAAASGPAALQSEAGAEELLVGEQLATVLGAMAAWDPQLQGQVIATGAPAPLMQLLLATLDPAVAAAPAAAAAASAAAAAAVAAGTSGPGGPGPASTSAGTWGGEADMDGSGGGVGSTDGAPARPTGPAGPAPAEAPSVRCCTTALWAVGMLVRGRAEETAQLAQHQTALLAGLRRLLLLPRPHLPLLREAAWLAAFVTAAGGPEAVAALVGGAGLLPGLLLSTIGCVRAAALLTADDPATQAAAQPLNQALQPLLLAVTNVAAEPAQALPLLVELQALRPLPPLQARPADADTGVAEASGDGESASGSGMQALQACLEGRVSHRGVVRGAAGMVAGLAWGACRAGAAAVDAVRSALAASGLTAALVALVRSSALDIRKEAAAALVSLCVGAADADGAGGAGGAAAASSVAALAALGISRDQDAQGVLAAFLNLLRSPDSDAVHIGLRLVSLVLCRVRRGAQLVESLDGIDALEAVQFGTAGCRVPELQAWAGELVDTHYGEDYGEGDEDEEDL